MGKVTITIESEESAMKFSESFEDQPGQIGMQATHALTNALLPLALGAMGTASMFAEDQQQRALRQIQQQAEATAMMQQQAGEAAMQDLEKGEPADAAPGETTPADEPAIAAHACGRCAPGECDGSGGPADEPALAPAWPGDSDHDESEAALMND